jgi:hypothetical protein
VAIQLKNHERANRRDARAGRARIPAGDTDRIVGALANLGAEVSHQTVGNILKRHGIAPARKRSQTTRWNDFIRAHMAVLAGVDFFAVEVLSWRGLVKYYACSSFTLRAAEYASPA